MTYSDDRPGIARRFASIEQRLLTIENAHRYQVDADATLSNRLDAIEKRLAELEARPFSNVTRTVRPEVSLEDTPVESNTWCPECKTSNGHMLNCPTRIEASDRPGARPGGSQASAGQPPSIGNGAAGVAATPGNQPGADATNPADHFRACGPFCKHVKLCPECMDVGALCERHAKNPDGTFAWVDSRVGSAGVSGDRGPQTPVVDNAAGAASAPECEWCKRGGCEWHPKPAPADDAKEFATPEEFAVLCNAFGLEVDEITSTDLEAIEEALTKRDARIREQARAEAIEEAVKVVDGNVLHKGDREVTITRISALAKTDKSGGGKT